MSIVDRIIGRSSVLEIVAEDSRLFARRYVVTSHAEHGHEVTSVEMSDDAFEEFVLPLSARDASTWLYRHFEDLTPVEFRAAHARLTRPVNVVGDLA